MEKRSEKIRAFILANITNHPRHIVAVTADEFSVTRTTVHRHLKRLVRDKKVVKTGTTNRVLYSLSGSRDKVIDSRIEPGLEEHIIWQEIKQDFSSLKKNIFDICEYGFTEIFNNAIDHSEGRYIRVKTEWHTNVVKLRIIDDGIGTFKKIKAAFSLADERESILQLSKGKITTDPEKHTGEGIFFTSKAFDKFSILANGLFYQKSNIEDDWLMETRGERRAIGTVVFMEIGFSSKRDLRKIFNSYSNPETYKFDKTHILVELSKLEEESYISRSQAKRLLFGLEKFREVILDFRDVTTVGQGFVDEVFRIFKKKHPNIKIEFVNANDDVRFMIQRC